MIRREDGEILVECEECGHEEYAGTLEFRDFIDELKRDGWKICKDGDEWIHTCPTCVEE